MVADAATPRERELIARLPAPLRSMSARDVARVAVEAFGIVGRARASSPRTWRAYARALARETPTTDADDGSASRAGRRDADADERSVLESLVDGLTTCARCGRAVPAESLDAHAARRCDGGASKRARDVGVRAVEMVREEAGVEERGRGRMESRGRGGGRAGGGRGGAGRGGGGRGGGGRASETRAWVPKPLAVRADVREARRAHDATVFRYMFDARASAEAEEADASPETSARAKKVAKVEGLGF